MVSWVPEAIDELAVVEEGPGLVVGGVVEVYSSFPEDNLPRELDCLQPDEAEFLFGELAKFSKENKVNFEIEYNREVIGEINGGSLKEVEEMLFDEWRKELR